MTILSPHPDRLFPADPTTRAIARRLYAEVANSPIVSPHGHVDAETLRRNDFFPGPSALLITPDHYVTRLLHAAGVPLADLGLARPGETSAVSGREIWRALCSHWDAFLGTPVRYWFETELHEVFGLTEHPSPAAADAQYDQIETQLATEAFRPRALFDQFRIDVLATTDDPADDLAAHAALRDDESFHGRVVPTFRADRYMTPIEPTWITSLERLGHVSGVDCTTYHGLLEALQQRRNVFRSLGATSTDTGVIDASCAPLDPIDAERLHLAGVNGSITAAESDAYRHNMLYRFAEMSANDGLVMQLHPGVIRNHHQPTFAAFGADTGHDLPDVTLFTRPLQPILRDFGTNPVFRLVLFTVDESAFSREIGPLAGFYPSVFAGAPWWFLDTPAAISRYRAAVTDSAGFTKTSGFIDDTRAFCSIPARHDMSRRSDAAFLASMVATHQITEDDAATVAVSLVSTIPRDVFRLD